MRIYKRSDSPFWSYDFAWNGQRYRGSTKETDRRQAEVTAHAILAEIKKRPGRADRWALTHVIATWWDEHAQHTRSSDAIWSNVENLNRCLDCSIMMDQLAAPALLDFRAKRRGEGATGPTINRDMAYLKAAINHAHRLHGKRLPELDWKSLSYPENPARIRFLSAEEYARLLAAADEDMVPVIIAAVTTGLRKSNLVGDTDRRTGCMQWHQVDLAGSTITITRTKGHRPSVKRIVPALRDELLKIRRRKGDVFDTKNFKRRWHSTLDKADLQDFRFHDLRHTFATWARKGGADLIALQNALDHGSITMTMRYAHIDADSEITAFDRASTAMTAALDSDQNGTIDGTEAKKKA